MAKDYATEMQVARRAAELFPEKVVYRKKDVARILGVSESTIYHDRKRFPNNTMTIQEIVRAMR